MWDCWAGDQGADDDDCLGDRLYTFASVRNSDNNGVCSQGTRHFLVGTPSCSDLRFVDTSGLTIVPLFGF